MGVEIEASLDGTAPLILHARHPDKRLNAIDYSLPIASAQVKSCLLLAALAGNGITILREPGLSRDHTERLFRKLGIRISTERLGITNNIYLDPQPKIGIPPFSIRIPGDISSAAFLWVGGLITPGSEIVVEHVGLNPTRNGLYNALSSMGGELMITELHDNDYEPTGTTRIRHARLSGVNISGDIVVRMIDEFPAFGIAASFASGTSVIRDAIELRHKESDRIHAFCSELARVGGHAIETEDGFIVHGGHTLNGGSAESHNDHRLGMAFAVAGQASKEAIIIQNSEIINESFPGFVDVMKCLGARIQQINE
jgi:3-phosphoshikimate 1-carboxyvinyltransferase